MTGATYSPTATFYAPGRGITGAWIGSNTATRSGISGSEPAAAYAAGLGVYFQGFFSLPAGPLKTKILQMANVNSAGLKIIYNGGYSPIGGGPEES
jgi:hypothetical protein